MTIEAVLFRLERVGFLQKTDQIGLGEGREGEDYERTTSANLPVVATACKQRGLKATREAPTVIAVGSTGSSRETGRPVWGDGEACSTNEAG